MEQIEKKIAIKTKDFKKRVVVWYKESYDDHINKHKDIKKCFNKFYDALQKPDLQENNIKRKSLDLYSLVRCDKRGENLYLKVVVDYNRVPGVVITAHLTSDTGEATICI